MSNFKDWCNKNPGYLTFLTLVCGFIGIIITIILSSKVTINPKGLLTFLNFKIPIPLYIFILTIFLIFIALYRTKKKVVAEIENEIIINSDTKTIFLESITYPHLPKNIPIQICDRPFWLSQSRKYPVLSNSHWISHTMLIQTNEAIQGGIYILERTFELIQNTKRVQSAVLHFLVDDYCRLFVNDSLVLNMQGLEKSSSYTNLHSFDIKDYLISGINHIKFEIENCDFHDQMKPNTPFFKSQNKGDLNPYGIAFNIKITLK